MIVRTKASAIPLLCGLSIGVVLGSASEAACLAGDVGYVPQGYGHYIENAGSADLELLIVLNNGTYESISLANWMGANPQLLLGTNFEVPDSTFKDFLTRDRFMPG